MMPLEIGWSITVSWEAGDAMCRIMAFFRIFGLYLSSFVIVCISIDRSACNDFDKPNILYDTRATNFSFLSLIVIYPNK